MKKSILIIFFSISSLIHAQLVDVTGSTQFPYKPSGFSGKPKTEEINSAIKAAKLNALSRYVADDLDQNSRLNFQKIQSSIEADIDRVIPSASILRNDYDKRQKLIFISLRASINSSMIRDRLVQSGAAAQMPTKEKSYVCGAFVARRQTEVTSFDEKRVVASRDEVATEEFEEVASNGVSTTISADQRRERTSTSAGSRTQKSDSISWDIFPSEVLDSSMSGILKTAGYRLFPASALGRKSDGLINLDSINRDYSTGNDLSQTTRDDMIEGCENLKISYLSTGTLSVQTATRHPVTGSTKVTVMVNAQVWDVSGFIPEVVASIGPVQYSALGDTQTTAENNAIKLAAEKAGQQIVSGLQQANAQ